MLSLSYNKFSHIVGSLVLPCVQMRHVNPALQSAEPLVRRAAYMTIAVSSEGCADHIRNKSVLRVSLCCKDSDRNVNWLKNLN